MLDQHKLLSLFGIRQPTETVNDVRFYTTKASDASTDSIILVYDSGIPLRSSEENYIDNEVVFLWSTITPSSTSVLQCDDNSFQVSSTVLVFHQFPNFRAMLA